MTGGTMHYAHIVPMTNAKQEEIRDAQDLKKIVKRAGPQIQTFLRRLNRARTIATRDNINEQSQRNGPDVWHVLVEMGTRRKIKCAAMSRREAWRRNDTLKDLRMEWTLGTM